MAYLSSNDYDDVYMHDPGDSIEHAYGRQILECFYASMGKALPDLDPDQVSENEDSAEQPESSHECKEPESGHEHLQPGDSDANQETIAVTFYIYYRKGATDSRCARSPIICIARFKVGTESDKEGLKESLKYEFDGQTSRFSTRHSGSLNVCNTALGLSATGYGLKGMTKNVLEDAITSIIRDMGGTIDQGPY